MTTDEWLAHVLTFLKGRQIVDATYSADGIEMTILLDDGTRLHVYQWGIMPVQHSAHD